MKRDGVVSLVALFGWFVWVGVITLIVARGRAA